MPTNFGSTGPFVEPLWYSREHSPYYSSSHRKLRAETRAYVDKHIAPFAPEWEAAGQVPDDVMRRHSELGYTAAAIYPMASKEYLSGIKLPAGIAPEEWDGFHDLIVIDEIARCGFLGVIWALSCGNSIGCPPLIAFGTESQKRKFLPDVMHGRKRFCLGVTEPDAGSDVAGIKTTAERRGDVYVINGSKKWITNGIFADYCTAAVRTGPTGANGISALIIPMHAKGVTCRKIENSGVAASGSTYIEFDEVEVPVENLLGKENEGFKIIMTNFTHERLWLAATSLRMARVCIEDAYSHAITRETFGRKLFANATIRSKFTDMGLRVQPLHSFMEQLVYLAEQAKHSGKVDAGMDLSGPTAMLKVAAARALEKVVRESQQVMGGLGYSKNGRGARIEQISRDVRVMVVGGGSDEILSDMSIVRESRELGGDSSSKL